MPLILLTATLPPSMKKSLEEIIILGSPRYLRSPTHRPNIEYCVCEVPVAESMIICVAKYLEQSVSFGPGDKAIIYCRSKDAVRGFRQHMKCLTYDSAMTVPERAQAFDAWAFGGQELIVATTALEAGIDIAGVRLVIHYEEPCCATGFAQESGRAGRDGKPAKSMVFALQSERDGVTDQISPDKMAMYNFVTTKGCRRKILSKYLDGVSDGDCLTLNGRHCDQCTDLLMGSG